MLRKSAISLAIMGALGSMQANALGLGEVKVSSALNQPLQAEIDLLQLRGLNESQVVTRLANTDDFYLAGVRPSPVLSDIRFKLDITGGQGKIVLTTSTPIREPFLNFLIEVNWPSGRLVREYTVLLDPPVFTAEDLAPRGQPVAPVVKSAAPAPSTSSAGKPRGSESAVVTASRAVSTSSQYSVTKTDTLWQIALKVRPDASISPQQMMLAIQRANPDAFIKNNINRLKSGVVLDIPSKEQILNFNAQESLQEVKRQNSSWKGAPAAADKSKTAKLDVAKEELSANGAAVVEDSQLRIVSKVAEETPSSPAESGAVASDASAADSQQPPVAEISAKNEELEEQLVVTLEGLNKVERDNVEMFDRLDRLSEQMASMQRLVELKDQQLAELQEQLARKQVEPVVPMTEESSNSTLPFEWIAAAGAALLALLAGLLLFMRKRKQEQEQDVDTALEQLNERDAVEDLPQDAETKLEVAAAAVTASVLDPIDDTAAEKVFAEEDSNDPFNMPTESRGPLDEFDSISDDELDSALGEDLDMDLKLDEPVIDDPEMSEFSNSLLDDDEYDLSTGFEDEKAAEVSTDIDSDLDTDLDTDLDSLLAENDAEGSGRGSDLDTEIDAASSFDADAGDDFDGDLDALLAEAEFEKSDEPAAGLDDALEDGFGSDLDELLSEEDDFSSDLDDLLAGDGSEDSLLAEEDSIDETLEQMLEEHDKNAESSGIEQVTLAGDDDIPDDETLDALLNKAADQAGDSEQDPSEEESDQGIDIEFDPIEELDELVVDELAESVLDTGAVEEESSEFSLDTEQDLIADLDLDDVVSNEDLESAETLTEADKSEISDDGFVFELDDATDDELDFSVDESDTGAETNQRSSLSLEDELDQADDAELEAELEQMLVSKDNDLALQETDLDDEVNYLDGADEIGTKIDLARAYIDMEDQEGARDILQEVITEGSPEQVAEAKQLLESLNS